MSTFCTDTVLRVETPVFPARSRARSWRMCVPLGTWALFQSIETEPSAAGAVVTATEPSTTRATESTPVSSAADPVTPTVPSTVVLSRGAVSTTVGGDWSTGVGTPAPVSNGSLAKAL